MGESPAQTTVLVVTEESLREMCASQTVSLPTGAMAAVSKCGESTGVGPSGVIIVGAVHPSVRARASGGRRRHRLTSRVERARECN